MATGISNDNGKDCAKEWKLKKVRNFWFLGVGGRLKRLNLLNNAKDVHIEDNIIFADDVMYQLAVKDDGEIVIQEIEDVRQSIIQYSNHEVKEEKDSTLDAEKVSDKNDNVDAGSSRASLHLDETQTTPTTEHRDAPESEDDSLPDSDTDYDLERGHEEYVPKKGIFRGFIDRIKNVVKKKPDKRQKEEPLYDDIPTAENEVESSNVGKEPKDDNDYEMFVNLKKQFNNTDEVTGSKLVTAMYDFKAFLDGDISFTKNDRLKVQVISQKSEWCRAEHLKTGQKGYIPHAYVTSDKHALQAREWWFDIDRISTDVLLKSSGYPTGTFLVRESKDTNKFILSVLADGRQDVSNRRVAHYRIKSDNGRLYISARRLFSNIFELIDFYKSTADGLVCKLGSSPPKKAPFIYPRKLEIGIDSFDVKEPVNCGIYGTLFRGKFSDTLDVTIAEVAKGQQTVDDFLTEAGILYNFRCSETKIIKVIAVCVELEHFRVIIGETIFGTLKEYLLSDRGKTVKIKSILKIAAEVADGMSFLETKNVIHRHLKAACVFVCDLNVVKIAHPNLISMLMRTVADPEINEAEAWKWTAPEAVSDTNSFNTKSDVWSYGVLLYEVITFGETPYKDFTEEETLTRLEKGFRLQKPVNCPVECPVAFYITILKCWHRLPECRPTFDFLREFFLDFDVAVEYEIGLEDANIQDLYMCGPLEEQSDSKPGDQGEKTGDNQPSASSESASNVEGKVKAHDDTTKIEISKGFSVKVLYDYRAETDDEITINPDEIITDVDPVDEGWWLGTNQDGKRGLFPSNYIEMFENCYADVTKL